MIFSGIVVLIIVLLLVANKPASSQTSEFLRFRSNSSSGEMAINFDHFNSYQGQSFIEGRVNISGSTGISSVNPIGVIQNRRSDLNVMDSVLWEAEAGEVRLWLVSKDLSEAHMLFDAVIDQGMLSFSLLEVSAFPTILVKLNGQEVAECVFPLENGCLVGEEITLTLEFVE